MLKNTEIAIEILTELVEKEEARNARKDWGLYDYVGQEEEEEEDDEDFNLSDSEVCKELSSDEVLEILKPSDDFAAMKELYKRDKLLLLTSLCSALEKASSS